LPASIESHFFYLALRFCCLCFAFWFGPTARWAIPGRQEIDAVFRDGTLVIFFDDPESGAADYDLTIECLRK
jgi:hypothetical protein